MRFVHLVVCRLLQSVMMPCSILCQNNVRSLRQNITTIYLFRLRVAQHSSCEEHSRVEKQSSGYQQLVVV